jgi:putative hemolysin
VDNVLHKLEITHTPLSDKNKIPASGPLIVVANHPFGGIDGLILTSILSKVRRDIPILANHYLGLVPELKPILFSVDPFGSNSSVSNNIGPLRKAAAWVKKGGLLVTFPAGEVAHLSILRRKIIDPSWHSNIGRLVHITRSSVLPVFFYGKNSSFFQIAGLVHPLFRTALLPRQLLNKRSVNVKYNLGIHIPYRHLSDIKGHRRLTSYLRFWTELLEKSAIKGNKILTFPLIQKKRVRLCCR